MKDTHKKIEDMYHEMLMRLSPEERLKMGCAMFDVARKIVMASLHEKLPHTKDFRPFILNRFYGSELEDAFKQRFLEAVSRIDFS